MLKDCRNSKNLTQKQLEKLSGVSQSYISKLEKCTYSHSPTLKQIISLSKALNINPIQLANWFICNEIRNSVEDTSSCRINKSFIITKRNSS